jgi:outer membrane protein assembly factor BamB
MFVFGIIVFTKNIRSMKILKVSGFIFTLALIVVLSSFYLPRNVQNPNENPQDSIADSLDLTAFFQKINKDAKLSSEFRKGHVTKADLKTGLKKTESGYEIQLSRTNVPSPVVYKGKVFVSGGFGSKQYYAFDAKTGEKIWSVNLDDDGPSSAAIVDDIIVFNTESCTIFACKIETGEQVWSYWLGDPLMSMPTIANGIVFTAYPGGYGNYNLNNMEQQNVIQQNNIGNNNVNQTDNKQINTSHVLIAIKLRSGKILWQKKIDGDVMSAPVAIQDELYVSTFPGTVFKFKQKTGEILSARSVRATSAPVIYRDQIFLSKRSDIQGEEVSEAIVNYSSSGMKQTKVYRKKNAPYLDKNVQEKSSLKDVSMAYDAGNGFAGGAPSNSGWMQANQNIGQSNVSSLQSFQGSRTLYHKGFNYNTMGDEIICTNAESGKEKWKLKIEGDIKSVGGFLGTPPIAVGDKIVIASYDGKISIHDSKTGKVTKTFKIEDNIRYQPIIEDGWIYVTTTSGKMVAVNTRDKNLKGWPMWGANAARTNINE